MDFEALLKPYSENGRTVKGQIKWLISKGLTREIVDQTILKVFDELSRGKSFADGHELDRYLYDMGKSLQDAGLEKQAKELENFMTSFKESWEQEFKNRNKPGFWQRVKAVFKP